MSEEDTQAAETSEEETSSVSLDGINQNVVKLICVYVFCPIVTKIKPFWLTEMLPNA